MAISKKTRFEVFKRDAFQCQYCGKKTPSTTLEVDHIHPKSKGGKDCIDNLITSCFDCNRGKGARNLTVIPENLVEKTKRMNEAQSQYRAYKKALKAKADSELEDINLVVETFETYFNNSTLREDFMHGSVKNFIYKLGVYEVKEAMKIACAKIPCPDNALSYFCGICWNKIRNKEGQL